MYKADFELSQGHYFLSHSVGRPLKRQLAHFQEAFIAPWQTGHKEPWGEWLDVIHDFRGALAALFHSEAPLFCPQVNLSSALTKLLMAHPRLSEASAQIVMSEIDFPSMGFAMQKAMHPSAKLAFITQNKDITDPDVWHDMLKKRPTAVFVSHVYSNTGQRAPIAEIISLARQYQVLVILDVAQSAGVIPLDLSQHTPDAMIGSSVKWLCGGPGAAYLWLKPQLLSECEPKDVGWFSHENPFEMNIHDFRYADDALKFWGGTPSVAPYALASSSIAYFAERQTELHAHNQACLDEMHALLGDFARSPSIDAKRSGTFIAHFGKRHDAVMATLNQAGVYCDSRSLGARLSPHLYIDKSDIEALHHTIAQSV